MKPVIGIIPMIDDDDNTYYVVQQCMQALLAAGAVPVLLPVCADPEITERSAGLIDGLLMPGAPDLEPSLYGEEKLPCCGQTTPARDDAEIALLKKMMELDKPVFGFCRGLQLLNVVLGGTLYQDLPSQLGREVIHRQQPPFSELSHAVNIVAGTPLAELIPQERLMVNSVHHQGIKDHARNLVIMARSDDGLVEGAYLPGYRYVFGVQWHPEFTAASDDASMTLFRHFVEVCRG